MSEITSVSLSCAQKCQAGFWETCIVDLPIYCTKEEKSRTLRVSTVAFSLLSSHLSKLSSMWSEGKCKLKKKQIHT